jgi:3-dehydroquinate dehydratase/shikimate dehydrogenase
MICVSIGRGRHRHVIAEHRHLVQQGAKLVELRLDYINGQVNLRRLLADKPCPVIITCRREQDGGKFSGSEEQRMLLLRTAIAEGVEYVDLEEDVAGSIPRFGKTKRIVSVHDFRKTPDDLEAIHAGLVDKGADIVKLATLANQPHDNVRMLRLISQSKVPTIGLCMGDMGVPSRLLSGRYGSPFTYATFHHERALAPGQLSFQQMTDNYRYDGITPETGLYGVIGDPIGHSHSPLIHNAAFGKLNLNKAYLPFRIRREDLGTFFEDAAELDIKGLSVTIPHKEAVMPLLTRADKWVQGIGAANTVVFDEGRRIGYNTDCPAAIEALEEAVNEPAGDKSPLAHRVALILGAGGAARAIAYGLMRCGAHVVIASRSLPRAEELAKALKCKAIDWSVRHAVTADVLINCTPVGMHPNVDEAPYDKHRLRPSMIVFDTVYNPETTLLVKEARARCCTVVTGVAMFIRQAALQFKLFTGRDAPTELMRDVLKRAIGPAKY